MDAMQVLFELAEQVNKVPLPEFTERHGLRLPHEDDCLTAQPYYFAPRQSDAIGDDSVMTQCSPLTGKLKCDLVAFCLFPDVPTCTIKLQLTADE